MTSAPGRSAANSAAPRTGCAPGTPCSDSTSACASRSAASVARPIPAAANSALSAWDDSTTTRIPSPCAIGVSARATWPQPQSPKHFPPSASPRLPSRQSSSPASRAWVASGSWRAAASISPSASSATSGALAPGVLTTRIPRSRAAAMSMRSTPVPWLPITRRCGAKAIASAGNPQLRVMTASARSSSGTRLRAVVSGAIATSRPASCKSAIPAGSMGWASTQSVIAGAWYPSGRTPTGCGRPRQNPQSPSLRPGYGSRCGCG
ncbi:hypothetical protein AKL17_3843 [Frigidibacter mobilis]|uniref:Uncharacterized protein n=1 Tax=Frigidibacter mobilis TaxID=1335048 RepID=A0A159Z6R9_9RHOB|nr:hypothetical protein AKL17_3843 [Frigidibacter mobilis]